MNLSIVPIGNSKGIRIPKSILKKCEITKKVHLSIKGNKIILEPVSGVREGWSSQFEKIQKTHADDALDLHIQGSNKWDESEWD